MNVTSSGYVLEFPHVLDELRAAAAQCRNPAHLDFVTTAITAFEQQGPTAEPLLNGCPERAAQLIFEEVTEAYITAEQAARDRTVTLVRDFHRPYTRHRRTQTRQAERNRRLGNTTGLDRLRLLLTIPVN